MWGLEEIVRRNDEAAERALRGEPEVRQSYRVIPQDIAVVFPVSNPNSEWIKHAGELLVKRGYKGVRAALVGLGIQVGNQREQTWAVGYSFQDVRVTENSSDIEIIESARSTVDTLKDLAVIFGQDTFRATINGTLGEFSVF